MTDLNYSIFMKQEETQANWENPGFTSFMFLILVNNLEIDNQKCRNLTCSIVIYLMLKLTDASARDGASTSHDDLLWLWCLLDYDMGNDNAACEI